MAAALKPQDVTEDVRTRVRSFLSSMADVPLELLETVIDEELTLLETAGTPWSPARPAPLTTEEIRFMSAPLCER